MNVNNISFSYGSKQVIDQVSMEIETGKITCFVGPNGSGKTTLFHLVTRGLQPQSGAIELEGENISQISLREFSRRVAIVHQYNTAPSDLSVEKLVSYGRTPYLSYCKGMGKEDWDIAEWAMELTAVTEHRKTPISQLSGGQRQRVWIAMALAQKTDLLFLDEPTTYLDIRYQIDMLKLIRKLNEDLGVTIVMVLHDINQAVHYSDRIIGMKAGRILADVPSEEILNPDILQSIFDVRLSVGNMGGNEKRPFIMTV